MELIVDRVSKQYGSKIAVDRVSLKLQKGVYGLLGANGAGKTTLMRLICGILKPTSGTVSLWAGDKEGWMCPRKNTERIWDTFPRILAITRILAG